MSRLRFFVSEHFRVFLCASADSASCGIISLDSALQVDIGSIEITLSRRQLSEHPPGRFEKVHVGVDADLEVNIVWFLNVSDSLYVSRTAAREEPQTALFFQRDELLRIFIPKRHFGYIDQCVPGREVAASRRHSAQ